MVGQEGRQGLVGYAFFLGVEQLHDGVVELPRRLEPLVWLAHEGLPQDSHHRGRQGVDVLFQHVEPDVEHLVQGLEVVAPQEEPPPQQELGEHAPGGEEIGAVVHLDPGPLLRGHVAVLALEPPRLRAGLVLHQGDAEVADLHVAAV